MEIRAVQGDRKRYMPLLLLADEQSEMVARYIDRGDMWVLAVDGRDADTGDVAVSESPCTVADAGESAGVEVGAGSVAPVLAECLVTDEGAGVLEIKNLAVDPAHQGKGYGRALIEHVARTYKGRFHTLQVGTGDSPLTVPFYERCGFVRAYVVEHFFLDHYDHPIFEAGVQLVDMVYLVRKL